jgi:hypothetical protein
MKEWIVHVGRQHTERFNARTNNGLGVVHVYLPFRLSIDFNVDRGTEGAETYYVDNEESANALALELSKKLPGSEVFVCRAVSRAYAAPQEPVLAKVTEKGILPK